MKTIAVIVVLAVASLFGGRAVAQSESPAKDKASAVNIEISAAGSLRVDGLETQKSTFKSLLRRKAKAIRAGIRGVQKTVVAITADGEATFRDVRLVIRVAQDSLFEQFALHIGKATFRFDAPLAAPAEGLPDVNALPPLRVRLHAGKDGSLLRIVVNDRELPSLIALQQFLIGIIGKYPGSHAVGNLLSDDGLKLKHLAAAHEKVNGYIDANGKRRELIKNIRPIAGGSEIEVIEVIPAR